jgi:plasmid stabilization system protein ParE
MDFKVIFRKTFRDDLERILRYISESNPEAAGKLGGFVVDACERLSFFPERYPAVSQRPHIRRLIVAKHYKVFYRVKHKTKKVEILRCWDARRESDPKLGK